MATALVVLSAHHVDWLHHFRSGRTVDIDEAGYLSFGLDDLHGWRTGTLRGLHHAVVSQRQFAPLVPLASTPILASVGDRPIAAMSVQLLFLGVLAFATLGIARALAGTRAGVLAALVTLALPGIVDFTRTFHFVLAVTAFLTAAVWALVRSEGLRHRRWVVVVGACAGLMLLARTMTVAFLPVLALACLFQLLAAPARERARRAWNLLLAGGAGLAVCAWWYGPNLGPIFEYLFGYGYGSKSVAVGDERSRSVLSLEYWTDRLAELVREDLYLAIAVVFAATVALALGIAWRRRSARPPTRGSRWDRGLASLTSPVGTVAWVVVGVYLALTTSANRGTGFAVPLLPLLAALWAAALAALPARLLRGTLAGAAVLALVATYVSKSTVDGLLAGPSCVRLPVVGCMTVVDARGVSQRVFDATTADPTEEEHEARARAWLPAADAAATWAIEFAAARGVEPVIFFASRDPLFNTNTVGLEGRLHHDHAIPMGQLRPDQGGDTVRNYRHRLDDPQLGWPNILVAIERGPAEYRPVVDQERAVRAARSLGFELVYEMALPDGRIAHFYWLQRGPTLEP